MTKMVLVSIWMSSLCPDNGVTCGSWFPFFSCSMFLQHFSSLYAFLLGHFILYKLDSCFRSFDQDFCAVFSPSAHIVQQNVWISFLSWWHLSFHTALRTVQCWKCKKKNILRNWIGVESSTKCNLTIFYPVYDTLNVISGIKNGNVYVYQGTTGNTYLVHVFQKLVLC